VGLLIQIGIGLLIALLVAAFARTDERLRVIYRFRNLRTAIHGYPRIQVVVSSISVDAFPFEHDGVEVVHDNPPNVLFIPLPEGRAIASLIELLRRAQRKATIDVITPDKIIPTDPIFAIGGPSVNPLTRKIVHDEFPQFSIEYPEARRAHFENMTFDARRASTDDSVEHDCGFIFITRTNKGAPIFVFCGITAFGTAAAVEWFAMAQRRSDAGILIRRVNKGFLAINAGVSDLDLGVISLRSCVSLST
jgi:hypothetical protein